MKYALVTGGSRGIGKAIALRLAKEGYAILVNYLNNREAAENTLHDIEEAGGRGELLPFDVSDPKAIDTALENWETTHPDDFIAALVNNAGIRHDNLLVFMKDHEWHDVLNTNLNPMFYITRRLVKSMISNRFGRIINISSISGVKGIAGQMNYSAAKAAMIGATKALAQELGRRNITVNAVAPGFIDTDMTEDIDENQWKKLIPAGRFGKPEEVAALVGFLASDEAGYITAQCIQIDGGMS